MKKLILASLLVFAPILNLEAQADDATEINKKCFQEVITRQTIFFERFVLKKIYQDEIQECSNKLMTQKYITTLDQRYIKVTLTDDSYRSSFVKQTALGQELQFDQPTISDSPMGYQQLSSDTYTKESPGIRTVDGYTSVSE